MLTDSSNFFKLKFQLKDSKSLKISKKPKIKSDYSQMKPNNGKKNKKK